MRYDPVQTFLQEAEELLSEIEAAGLSLAGDDPDEEVIHRLFRAFHTIKGSGAMCGLDAVAEFTHHVETLLDKAREGAIPVTPQLADLVLKSRDHIKLLLNAGQDGPPELLHHGNELIAAIEELAETTAPVPLPRHRQGAAQKAEQVWRILFRPNPGMLACGGNPAALFAELRSLGTCEVCAHLDEIPALDALQVDVCYFWWTVTLTTSAAENALRDVFIFVEEGSTLEIGTVSPATPEVPATIDAPAQELLQANATAASPGVRQKTQARESTVRVPSGRLDRLVNLVGELVMNQSRLAQAAAQSGAPELTNPVQELERLVAELRDDVLGIRMLPIGTIFGRFRRLVHDLSAELGKEVDLVTEGAETEMDKSILDQLGEPLVHCLRNCLDHGVEPPAERVANGKPRRAVVHLSAAHTGTDVVVSVQDDGRGISRDAVRAKAIEKQLIAPDAILTDKEIVNLILLPGFSTARQITGVSGRGVGMDAVKRQIDALRGTLLIDSQQGKGTRVSITLPLTLAIIDGLLVQVGADRFIVPMAAVTENVELLAAQRSRNNGRNVIDVRGELISYIDLRSTFEIEGEAPPVEKVVIVRHEGDRVGLVVDRVLGTHQTVIQSLGKFFGRIEVTSGATIMGDGRVALILDIAAVVRFADGFRRSDGGEQKAA